METQYLPKNNNYCVRAAYKKKHSWLDWYNGALYVYNEARVGSTNGEKKAHNPDHRCAHAVALPDQPLALA